MNKEEIGKLKPGARVRVWERIQDGEKERETPFEGIVIARKHGTEPGASFTVRASIQNIGVEKVYPIHSPMLKRIEFLEVPKRIKRSKLYYLRDLPVRRIREKLRKLYK
ncbi:MAG TPA: 50S ribosomal protein L19 [Candidatus Jorgensenbacteria bacterium]|nr:50S ribosomal protein L19 [Candidatus Jorgensenbacteria bacterium]